MDSKHINADRNQQIEKHKKYHSAWFFSTIFDYGIQLNVVTHP